MGLSTQRAKRSEAFAEILKFSDAITKKLLNDSIISETEVNVIAYGLESLGSNIYGLFIILTIGSLFHHTADSFFIWLLVFPLRKYAGGYHAETKGKCLFISIGMILISYFIFFQFKWKAILLVLITVVFSIIILATAPVGNINKPLDTMEQKIYRKKTRVILLLEEILFSLALFCNWNRLIVIITICFFMTGISLLAGKMSVSGNSTGS